MKNFIAVAPPDVVLRYIEFLCYFAIYGALGFRFLVLRSRTTRAEPEHGTVVARMYEGAQRTAARIGLAGASLLVIELVITAARHANSAHPGTLKAVLHPGPKILIQLIFGLLALVGFTVAPKWVSGGWAFATIAGVGFLLRSISTGRWTALVNPLHEAGAGLWLGTLFVILIAGLPAVMRTSLPQEQRGRLVANLVGRFSTLALCAATLMALTGVVTAWTHLRHLSALWTTAYGCILDLKLGVVAVVAILGAWNWRRVTPKLEAEEGGRALRRSSTIELGFAAIVLLLTAVLVLVPILPSSAPASSHLQDRRSQ